MENPIEMDDLGGKPTIFGNSHIFFPRVFFNRPFQVSAVFQDGIGSEDAGKRTPASPDQRLGMLSRGGLIQKDDAQRERKKRGNWMRKTSGIFWYEIGMKMQDDLRD